MVQWSMLTGLEDEDRRRVLAAARRRRFARRQVLFHEGDPGDVLHLIASGHVAVQVTSPLGDVATLAVRGPGQVVGELALVDHSGRRSATVAALEQTETYSLHQAQLTALRRRHPQVDAFLDGVLAATIRETDKRLVEALYATADTRVVRRLLDLGETYGEGAAGTVVPLTQEDLASLAGTSRATTNRVLRDLESAGQLELRRGKVIVVDPAALARRAR